jgi:hypothetical protein
MALLGYGADPSFINMHGETPAQVLKKYPQQPYSLHSLFVHHTIDELICVEAF